MAVLRAKTRTKLFFRQNRPCRCVSQGFSPPVGERHLRENRTEPFAMICAQIEAQICKKWPFSAIFGVSFIYKIIHRDFTTGNFRAIRRRVINIYKCYQPVLSTPQAWPWKTLSNIYIIIYNTKLIIVVFSIFTWQISANKSVGFLLSDLHSLNAFFSCIHIIRFKIISNVRYLVCTYSKVICDRIK